MSAAFPLAFAVGCVLAVWAGLFLLLSGMGRGLLAAIYGRGAPAPALTTCCWLGYAAAIVLLQLWHFWLPVDTRALAFLAALSLAGWWAGRGRGTRVAGPPYDRFVLVLTGILVLWLADRAIGPCGSYDSANYHLTLVRWFDRFAIVPGLANLNPVYGVNLSGLLLPALLEQGPGTGRSSHFANGFLVCLLLLHFARLLGRRDPAAPAFGPAQVGAALLLFPTVALISRGEGTWVSSLATDVPVALAVFAASCLIFEALGETEGEARRRELDPRLFAAFALLAILGCLKPTALVFAAATWFTLAAVWLRKEGWRPAARSRSLIGAVLFAIAAIAPWLARNVLLSGYPFFPAPFAGFDEDWRLPVEHARGILWWTRAYARTPAAWDLMVTQQGLSWLPYWARTELRTSLHDLMAPLALTTGWIALWLAAGSPRRERQPPLFILPLAIAIPIWFLTAPAIRFGFFFFWVVCVQVGAIFLPPVVRALPRRLPALHAILLFSTLAPLALHGYYALKYRGADPPRRALATAFWTSAGPDGGFHPLPQPSLERLTACRTLGVFVPTGRAAERGAAPWPETLPWDGPLPATALLLEGLCPRDSRNLAAGFRIVDGGQPWSVRNAARVAAVRRRTGWGPGRLAVHFCVRPELVRESLRLTPP